MSAAHDPGALPERIEAAIRRVLPLPWLAGAIARELALLVYAIGGWRMRPRTDTASFTILERSSWPMAAVGLGLVLLVETIPVHLLLARSQPLLAWIATAITACSLLWLVGDVQAMRLRPLRIEPGTLRVRVGLRTDLRVPLANIASASRVNASAVPARGADYLRATPIDAPTLLLVVNPPVAATGRRGGVSRVGLAPDDLPGFEAALRAARAEGARAAADHGSTNL